MAAKIKYLHTLHRTGLDDVLYGWLTRDGDTDAFYQWNGTGWTLLWALPGTDLIYSAVTWFERIFFTDGKHKIWTYDPTPGINEVCLLSETGPIVQYLIVHQNRLFGGGDARTQAEVEADGEVWPVDSNRKRILYSEVLDEFTWLANNFIDCSTSRGEAISGLGINSITTSTSGAQTQLVIFTPSATLVVYGTINGADQSLSIVSDVLGCPAYKTIVNTPFGLMFMSRETLCLLDTSSKEPSQPGFNIYQEFKNIPEALRKDACAIYHDEMYKIAFAGASDTTNEREWWLDLRPVVFTQSHDWYGPHSGDEIIQYVHFDEMLIAGQQNTTSLWQVDVEGLWRSMASSSPRTSIAITGRAVAPNMQTTKIDAYGFSGTIAQSTTVTMTVDADLGTSTVSNTWTSPASLSGEKPAFALIRPLKTPAHAARATITHAAASDIELFRLYVRRRVRRKQSEKQTSSAQG